MKRVFHIPLFLIFASGFGVWSAETLYVFFPSTARPHILQKRLSDINPKLDVIVFGRFADFEGKMNSSPPDAVLSLPEVIAPLTGYSIRFRGRKNGEESEPYFLLSIGRGVELGKIGGATSGAVDFLGRKRMKSLINGIFQSDPAVKTVTKVEDLLPLISFDMANAILVTESQVAYIKSISHLDFVKTPVPNFKSGTIGLAVKDGVNVAEIARTLKSMDEELLGLFGGVRWN